MNYRCFIYIQFNLKINRIYSQDTCWQIDSTIHIGSQFHIKWEYAQELSRSQDQLKLGPCNNRYAQLLTSNRNTLCTHCLIIVKKLKSENALTSSPALSRNFFQVLLNLKTLSCFKPGSFISKIVHFNGSQIFEYVWPYSILILIIVVLNLVKLLW